MQRYELSGEEIPAIQALLDEITARHSSVEEIEFQRGAPIYAHELPRGLRVFLNDFKLREPAGACIIAGYPIEDARLGTTPVHWRQREGVSPALREEIVFMLCGSLLGDIFGWSTQQDGYIIHDVLPIRGHEQEQLGSGSEQLLWWHTEDAFHPCRGDYLGLMCLRNPDNVATTFASIESIPLDQQYRKVLFEPRFVIRPDESHLEKNRGGLNLQGASQELVEEAYARINQMNEAPQKVPVLFGDPRAPYMRLDPYFMDIDQDDEEAKAALEAFSQSIDANLSDIVLQPGECLFIDNYRAVHGRKPFKARYDGQDRWLKRINITRDLRKSRDFRASSTSRIIL